MKLRVGTNRNLVRKFKNVGRAVDLKVYNAAKRPWNIFSKMKCTSISAWNTGNGAKDMTDLLSHHTTGVIDKGRWSSMKSMSSQQSSLAVDARALYSASVDEWTRLLAFETTTLWYFYEYIHNNPRLIFRSEISHAQSASENPWSWIELGDST